MDITSRNIKRLLTRKDAKYICKTHGALSVTDVSIHVACKCCKQAVNQTRTPEQYQAMTERSRARYDAAVANGEIWRCSRCSQEFPASQFAWNRRTVCRPCHNTTVTDHFHSLSKKEQRARRQRVKERQQARHAKAIEDGVSFHCTKCNTTKLANEFRYHNHSTCHQCYNAKYRERYHVVKNQRLDNGA